VTRGVVLPGALAPVVVIDVAVPEPAPGQVLIRMEACGICHSDLFIAAMEKPPLVPVVLGHEGIGRIERIGEGVTSWHPGDRVGVTFLAWTCGDCEWCHTGRERYCPRQLNSGYTVPGALAGYTSVSAQHLARVPDGLSAAEAAPMCCAGWTTYRAVKEAGLAPGATLAIFGMGGLGHLAVQYARHAGLKVAAVDISEDKLAVARGVGAEITVLAENAARTLQKQYGGMDAAVVLTASAAAIGQALRSLKRCGTLVLVGLAHGTVELPAIDTVLKGITIRGSFIGTRQDLEDVFRLAASGAVRPHVESYPLEDAPGLLEKLRRGEIVGRAVISF
jgi:propanol-preferring alcohol dehydrogenase